MNRRFVLLLATSGLGGCAAASLVTRQPPQLYALTPKSTFDADLPDLNRVGLQVEVPTAAAGLNTARIALKPTPTTLQYFAGATWIEVLPVMVQSLTIESFENTGSVEPFSTSAMGARGAWALRTYIREFQAEYEQPNRPPLVRVRLQARLLQLPRRSEVAAASFESNDVAASTRLEDIVLAMDDGLGASLRELVEWTLRSIDAAAPEV